MAYSTADGFKSTNRAPMMAHKRSMERKSASGGAGVMERSDPLGQPTEGDGGDHNEEEAKQTVMEHGPAHEAHVMHDHEGGSHTVHTMHPDGHEHHSEHASHEEAHMHAMHLSTPQDGAKEEMGEQQDEPEYE